MTRLTYAQACATFERSKVGHVRFFYSTVTCTWYEVVRFEGDRDTYWAPVSNVLDCRTGIRLGLRSAPYLVHTSA
jgi:hypothetical protein